MNKEKEILEELLRKAILYEEDKLREITIAEAKAALEIVKLASQSLEPENLMKGLGYCHFIQQAKEEVAIIGYDEINSSKEEIELLENEIARKLPIPDMPMDLMAKVEDISEGRGRNKIFFNNPEQS